MPVNSAPSLQFQCMPAVRDPVCCLTASQNGSFSFPAPPVFHQSHLSSVLLAILSLFCPSYLSQTSSAAYCVLDIPLMNLDQILPLVSLLYLKSAQSCAAAPISSFHFRGVIQLHQKCPSSVACKCGHFVLLVPEVNMFLHNSLRDSLQGVIKYRMSAVQQCTKEPLN